MSVYERETDMRRVVPDVTAYMRQRVVLTCAARSFNSINQLTAIH
jgi:hypothetical protein